MLLPRKQSSRFQNLEQNKNNLEALVHERGGTDPVRCQGPGESDDNELLLLNFADVRSFLVSVTDRRLYPGSEYACIDGLRRFSRKRVRFTKDYSGVERELQASSL